MIHKHADLREAGADPLRQPHAKILFCRVGTKQSLRRHRVFDARAPAFLAWGIPARTPGSLDEQHNQTCGSEYSLS